LLQGTLGTYISLVNSDGKSIYRVQDDTSGVKLWLGDAEVSVKNSDGWKGYPSQLDLGSKMPRRIKYGVVNRHGELALQIDGATVAKVFCEKPVSLRVGNLTHEDFAGLWSNILVHDVSFEFDGLTKDNAPDALEPLLALQKEAIDSGDLAGMANPIDEHLAPGISSLPFAATSLEPSNFISLNPSSEGRFTVRSGGQLVIRNGTVAVDCTPGQTIVFMPSELASMPDAEFVGLQVNTAIRTSINVAADRGRAIIPYVAPNIHEASDRVLVLSADVQHHQQVLTRAEINVLSSVQPSDAGVEDRPCTSAVVLAKQPTGRNLVFCHGQLMGSQVTNAPVQIDTANIVPGSYEVSVVSVTSGGTIEPPVTLHVTVGSRYAIDTDARTGAISVSPNRRGIQVKASPSKHSDIVSTRVFLDGVLAAESTTPVFDQLIDMATRETGTYDLAICGVRKDGSVVAPEHLRVSIQNKAVEELHAAVVKKKQLLDKLELIQGEISHDQASAKAFYEKALKEPDFWTYVTAHELSIVQIDQFSNVSAASLLEYSSMTFPGNAPEYFARSKYWLEQSAGDRLKLGGVQVQLGRFSQARDSFDYVIKQVGEDSPVGSEAVSEKKAISNENADRT